MPLTQEGQNVAASQTTPTTTQASGTQAATQAGLQGGMLALSPELFAAQTGLSILNTIISERLNRQAEERARKRQLEDMARAERLQEEAALRSALAGQVNVAGQAARSASDPMQRLISSLSRTA